MQARHLEGVQGAGGRLGAAREAGSFLYLGLNPQKPPVPTEGKVKAGGRMRFVRMAPWGGGAPLPGRLRAGGKPGSGGWCPGLQLSGRWEIQARSPKTKLRLRLRSLWQERVLPPPPPPWEFQGWVAPETLGQSPMGLLKSWAFP